MSYATVANHREMVFDSIRNSAYAKAINKLVGADTVVLDLGAGMGILGLLAAQAGARKVYLVEPEAPVRLALDVARASGLAERIEICQGRIEDIALPEQVDLILSVFTGNLLYSEDLLPSLFYARDRYLKPGGHLLPDRAELLLVPICAPELHDKYIECWSSPGSTNGLDFSAARKFAANAILWNEIDQVETVRLAQACVLAAVDFAIADSPDCAGKSTCRVERSGLCHGLLGWISFLLDGECLSTDPALNRMHWSNPVLPLDPPLFLEAGETIGIELHRKRGGVWSWSVHAAAGKRQHSEFLGRINDPRQLQRLAPDSKPQLDRKGQAVRMLLTAMQGKHSNAELALMAIKAFPDLFEDRGTADTFVLDLVKRFAGT